MLNDPSYMAESTPDRLNICQQAKLSLVKKLGLLIFYFPREVFFKGFSLIVVKKLRYKAQVRAC